MQTISSKATARVQLPALHQSKSVLSCIYDGYVSRGVTPSVLDYGAGRPEGEALSEYWIRSLAADYHSFDPYWFNDRHNELALSRRYDVVLCSNVLNVLEKSEDVECVILRCVRLLRDGGSAFFRVYEGDGLGVGRMTSCGWQRNEKTAVYEGVIRRVFRKWSLDRTCSFVRRGRVMEVYNVLRREGV